MGRGECARNGRVKQGCHESENGQEKKSSNKSTRDGVSSEYPNTEKRLEKTSRRPEVRFFASVIFSSMRYIWPNGNVAFLNRR